MYRTKAEVTPDPPYARLLSTLYRLRPMRRDPGDAPPVSFPIDGAGEPGSGALSPELDADDDAGAAHSKPRQRTSAATSTPGIILAVVALFLAVWAVVLGLICYRNHLRAEAMGEARAMILSIRAAEEVRRAEQLGYLGCGQCEGTGCDGIQGSPSARYPRASPDRHELPWTNPSHSEFECWHQLAVRADAPVRNTYSVIAGPAYISPPPIPGLKRQPVWPTPMEPWYLVQAVSDSDGDGVQSVTIAFSLAPDLYMENEGE